MQVKSVHAGQANILELLPLLVDKGINLFIIHNMLLPEQFEENPEEKGDWGCGGEGEGDALAFWSSRFRVEEEKEKTWRRLGLRAEKWWISAWHEKFRFAIMRTLEFGEMVARWNENKKIRELGDIYI
ncbi:hypothetical protein RJ639_019325 [Escallonia herrerae]|uniref:Uncharacterized protein n=1 Tax=Escallonia herrerae TaxID=1293975 RepID=A0AA89AHC3_9ASTE|nr:hypothetical protein RJ639_019325 [Escallonia herrerae]